MNRMIVALPIHLLDLGRDSTEQELCAAAVNKAERVQTLL